MLVSFCAVTSLRRYVAQTDNRITGQGGRVVATGKLDGGDSCPKTNDD